MIIRQANVEDAAGIARVYVDGWKTTYPGIVPEEYLANMSYEEHTERWRRILSSSDGFVYVAENEAKEIIGFIWGGPAHKGDAIYTGELHAIYVRKTKQHHGLGRQLVRTLAEKLLQEGIHAMIVWVLAANPSRHFYEALGARLVRIEPYEIAGVMLDDAGYGWKDIRTLL